MNRKSLGFLLLLLGTVLFVGGAIAGVRSFVGMVGSMEPLASFEAPGELRLTITEADQYTLWHDHKTWHEGSRISNPEALPAGYNFAFRSDTGANLPFVPASGSQSIATGSREAVGLGSFEVPAAGGYTLTAAAPGGERRILSVSQGNFAGQLAGSLARGFLFMILALLGAALTIVGIVLLILGRKKPGPPTLGASSTHR